MVGDNAMIPKSSIGGLSSPTAVDKVQEGMEALARNKSRKRVGDSQ